MKQALSKATIESELATRFGDIFKLTERRFADVISSGVPEVDSLTGGFPRGAITEIFGPASSGRTSLILATLAHASTHDEVCALIDTNSAFDPTSATKAQMDLDQLLWLRCDGNLERAFKATDLLLQGGGFGLVVLDLGDIPSPEARRIISSWWYRFRRVVENKPTVFIVIAAESCVRSCAALALAMARETDAWVSVSGSVPPKLELVSSRSQPEIGTLKKQTGTINGSSPGNETTKAASGLPQPTHSRLLRSLGARLERLKPVNLLSAEHTLGVVFK